MVAPNCRFALDMPPYVNVFAGGGISSENRIKTENYKNKGVKVLNPES